MYSQEQVASIHRESDGVLRDLRALSFRGMDAAQNQANPHARTYLTQGVGRRVQVLQHAMRDVFRLFPPEQTAPLTRENITAVQINLHAFVINLAGVFDNWAWAYLYRHNLLQQVGGSLNVGMFKRPTQEVLPAVLRDYLQRDIAQWQAEYVKTYRDTLAHRIPLYIPPAAWTAEDTAEYQRLEAEKVRLFREESWDQLDAVWDQQDRIGSACPMFLHEAVAGGNLRPVYLHPQMICDGMTVVAFGQLFYDHWHLHT